MSDVSNTLLAVRAQERIQDLLPLNREETKTYLTNIPSEHKDEIIISLLALIPGQFMSFAQSESVVFDLDSESHGNLVDLSYLKSVGEEWEW